MAHAAHAALLFLIIFATAAAARPLREAEEHPAVVRAPGLAAPAEQHRRLLDVVGASVLTMLAADNARDAIQVATATGSPSAAMYATASGVTNARLATPGIGSFGYYGLTYPGRRF